DSVIETGDDALVFYSTNLFGPARPCEDITVTNCRLSSSSSALKFCDGNQNCVRRVVVDNCVITDSNRGIAFMVFDGGYVSDVVLSNLVIDCVRRDWFWWGDGDPLHFNAKRRGEVDPRVAKPDEPPPGSIRNVLIRNVIARGQGSSLIEGHAESPLENVTIDGLVLHVSSDPSAPYDKTEHALAIRHARNFTLRDVEIVWDAPESAAWRSALAVEDARDLRVEGLSARQAPSSKVPVVVLERVEGATLRACRALPGTSEFLHLAGDRNRDVLLLGNDLRAAAIPFGADSGAPSADVLRSDGDLLRRP